MILYPQQEDIWIQNMFAIFKYSIAMRLWWDRKNKIRDNFLLLLLLFYITHVVVQLGPRVECCNE